LENRTLKQPAGKKRNGREYDKDEWTARFIPEGLEKGGNAKYLEKREQGLQIPFLVGKAGGRIRGTKKDGFTKASSFRWKEKDLWMRWRDDWSRAAKMKETASGEKTKSYFQIWGGSFPTV